MADRDADPAAGQHSAPEPNEPDETTQLLPDSPTVTEERRDSIYRTISRRSDAEFLPPDEEAVDSSTAQNDQANTRRSPWATLSLLLIGVFVSQADQSLVLATYGKIASEFHDLESGSWLFSAFILAQCAVQPLYGKLCDIYSPKTCLLAAYSLFCLGCLGIGLSRSIWEVVAWRAVQGLGSAGMVSVVSIVITMLVPPREIASTRSYVNVLQTTGRSCGGVIGGLITHAVGWRWSFLVQVPPTLLAIFLVAIKLKLPTSEPSTSEQPTRWQKLKRLDIIGCFFLSSTILALCLILDLGGQKLPWSSPYIAGLAIIAAVACILFIISAKLVREPIFPLHLLAHRDVITNYIAIFLGLVAQMSLMFVVPIYWQATSNASTAAAGAYLIPAFAGNTIGGLLAGWWIKRNGRYKIATILSPVLSIFCMGLLLLTWNGESLPAQSLFIFPGGMAAGIVSSSAFVGLVADLPEKDVSVAASGSYLIFNMGAIAGVSGGSAAFQAGLREVLEHGLQRYTNKAEIMRRTLADLGYISETKGVLHSILLTAYVRGFHSVNVLGIVCGIFAFMVALLSRETRLHSGKK